MLVHPDPGLESDLASTLAHMELGVRCQVEVPPQDWIANGVEEKDRQTDRTGTLSMQSGISITTRLQHSLIRMGLISNAGNDKSMELPNSTTNKHH
jgi:hypothetical protein